MKFLFTFLILIFTFQNLPAQDLSPKASLTTEFGQVCSEELMANYDSFFVQLNNDPTATGYFVVYGGDLEGRNLNYINYLMNIYPKVRGYGNSRLNVVRNKNQESLKIQFWVVPAGANPPTVKQSFVRSKITTPVLFDKAWADFNRDFGKLDIYADGFADLGCEFSPNVAEFSKNLQNDSELTGYLVVYTKFGKGIKLGKQIINFALKDMTKNYKISLSRLKGVYGGNRQRPEIELWLVPKNGKLPSPTPDKLSK